jgi:hypothetical protein
MQNQIDAAKQSQHRPASPARGLDIFESPPLHPVFQLQQRAGNQAVQALLRSGLIQPKLAISNPDDPGEREADQVAQTIMRSHAGAPASHCSCAGGEEKCEECQQQAQGSIRRHASAPDTPAHVPYIVRNALGSSGQPLDAETRAFFEPRFGHDFGSVRIHTGPEASTSARSINADAYTAGKNIVFGPGRFAPGTHDGRRLLAHELAHVVQQAGAGRIETAHDGEKSVHSLSGATSSLGGLKLGMRENGISAVTSSPTPTRRVVLGKNAAGTVLQRQPARPPSAESIDALWTDLHNFHTHGNQALAGVSTHIRGYYIPNYDGAYNSVVQRLSSAQRKEAEREKWKMALEVVAAVGIGLAGGELLEAGELLRETVNELVKKATEIGAVEALSQPESKVDFGLPPEVNNDREARGYLDQLVQAWQGMDEIAEAVLQFDTRVHQAERRPAPASGHHSGAHPSAAEPLNSEDVLRVRQRLTNAQGKLALFISTVDTPALERTQRQIEIDLWIRWISQSEANAIVAQGEEIAAHLHDIGAWNDLGDFEVTSSDSSDLVHVAKLQMEQLNQLGRVGVVVVVPFWSINRSYPLRGAVHVRADAYQAAGRVEPPQNGAPPFVAIEWQEGAHLLTGDVVVLAGTSPGQRYRHTDYGYYYTDQAGGLLPKRLGPLLPVDPSERAAALTFLGEHASDYPPVGSAVVGERTDVGTLPDRARPLVSDVWNAVEGLHVQPPLVVSESEEGVMVSEADGTRLVLFTVYTSWGEAKKAKERTGVRRVVTVELYPNNTFEDFDDQDVVVTRHANYAAQISAVRALLGRGPVTTVK